MEQEEDRWQRENEEWRPLKSLLRFVGGKSKLAAQIVERIPPHLAYVEPFAGGAWVFFQKKPSKVEVLNDLDGELVNFWRVIQNHPQEFFHYCARMVPSRALFEWERDRATAGLTDIQRASRYYYLQRLAFGGQMRNLNFGTSSIRPPGFHLAELRRSLPEIERRLQRVLIENLDALECIRRYDRATTFFYVDPPYWGERKYTLSLESTDYERLARELKQIKGRFLMTLNDCELIRRMFGEFVIEAAESGYFIANSRRARNARPKGGQLLIYNLKQ